jgi:hypothetical protein
VLPASQFIEAGWHLREHINHFSLLSRFRVNTMSFLPRCYEAR